MAFACIYIPDFLVQSVVRGEPMLRDRALAPRDRALAPRERALALISGNPPLWSVVAANPAAIAAGIQQGMDKSQATGVRAAEAWLPSAAQRKNPHARLL